MFEGLKETLGKFRDDVEEAAQPEPEAEPGPEPEPGDSAEQSAEPTGTERSEAEEGSMGLGRRARSLARGQLVIDEDDLESPLAELELALLANDVELGVAEEITGRVREALVGETRSLTVRTSMVVRDALQDALVSVLDAGEFDFDEWVRTADPPVVIMFTGVNGVGKTTTIAKVSRYLETKGYSSVLANGDTYRAGATEQLREHADRLGRKLIAHDQGGDPAAVIYDAVEYATAHGIDVVLGDTAGRLHTNKDLMNQLAKIDRVVGPDMTLFVDEAVAGQDAVKRAREFNEAASIDGTILTKADADTSGGAAISITHVTGKPIVFLGTGQAYEDLTPFDPERLAADLVGAS